MKKGDLVVIRERTRTWIRIPEGTDVGPYIFQPTLAIVTSPTAKIMSAALKTNEAAQWYIEVTTVDNQSIIVYREHVTHANIWTGPPKV